MKSNYRELLEKKRDELKQKHVDDNLITRGVGPVTREDFCAGFDSLKLQTLIMTESLRRIRHHAVGNKSTSEIVSEIDEALGQFIVWLGAGK